MSAKARAKARAAADAKRRGLDEAHRREAVREAEELAADPALNRFINDMEAREAAAEEKERRERIQRQNRAEREFGEALDRHYQDRLGFYRDTKGTPKADFDEHVWPELKRQYVAGEQDAVDKERREKATPIF